MRKFSCPVRALLSGVVRPPVALCMLAVLGGCVQEAGRHAATYPPVSIIPAAAEITGAAGSFELTEQTQVRFVAGSPGDEVAQYFVELLERTRGIALPRRPGIDTNGAGTIDFELRAGEAAADEEGYSLTVSPEWIAVSSRSPRGLFYGAVTLWQLLTAVAASTTRIDVPAMTITDAPRFHWRGLMLDSARHYQSPEFIKQFLDLMALHKLNVLHWHLTDDQAWRLQIRKYPKLTAVGAWRVPAGPAAAADIDPATGKPRLYGGFYTQDQVRDIVAYAAARYITIVPEIEMPGHASAAIAAYPRLGVNDDSPHTVPADWGVYSNLFNVEESTFAFLEDVLDEVIELFPGEYVHVGGDEAVKDQWKESPRVQTRMRELGVKDEQALQSYFVQRVEKYLNSHGRRLIGWDEILEGGIAPDATVMSWRGVDGAIAAAAAGHDAVLSPAPTLYFDYRPLDTPRPPGRGQVIGVEQVYRFDPAPAALNEAQRRHILGVQANVWTEHIRTEDRLEYMTFPRAAALAEVAWSPAARIDWPSFSARLPAQLARYEALGIRYAGEAGARAAARTESADPSRSAAQAESADRPESAARSGSSGRSQSADRARDTSRHEGRRTSHQLAPCSDKLVLSLEDDAPVRGERAIFLVDIMNPCWIYQDADLSQVGAIAASVGQVPFNFQIGDDVNHIPLRKPATAAGELEVRIDGCEGEKIATLPLAPAVSNFAVTQLPPAPIAAREGRHDLCLMFTQKSVDPTWVIDAIELMQAGFQPDKALSE